MSNTFSFRLHGIDVFNFEIKRKPKDFVGKVFSFDIRAEAKVNNNDKVVLSVIDINIRDENTTIILCTMTSAVGFVIENFDEAFVNNEKHGPVLNGDLEIILRAISISTARGILYSNLKGSYLHRAMLPVIFPLSGGVPVDENDNDIKSDETKPD